RPACPLLTEHRRPSCHQAVISPASRRVAGDRLARVAQGGCDGAAVGEARSVATGAPRMTPSGYGCRQDAQALRIGSDLAYRRCRRALEGGGFLRILLVEDDPDLGDAILRRLRREGYA